MTAKLNLQKLNIKDYNFWCDLVPGTTLKDFEIVLKRLDLEEQQDKSYSFVIETNEGPVGFIQVFNVLRSPACSGMIEIMISAKKRKLGYAKKAITLLEDICFNEMGLMRLIAPIAPDNSASIALFSSLGYEKYFTDKSAFFFNKEPVAHEMWIKIKPK